MSKEKFVKECLKPLIVAVLENVIGVRYTNTGSYEIVTVDWDDGKAVREVNVNVTGDSLLQLTEDVIGRLLR